MAGCGDESILKAAVMGREWAKQMKEQLADLKPYQLVPSIFPVPAFFRVWDPKSYTPQLVDLGPIHHSRPRLWESGAVKRRFLEQGQRRRRRFNSPAGGNIDDDLRNFTDQVVSPLLPAIRAQYDSPLDALDSTLASSLALDSLFLVELLLRGSCDDDDGAAADCASILMNDAVMLENQIPLFLLQQPLSALLQGRHSGSESGLFYEQLERVYHRLSPLQFLGSPNHNHPRHLLEYLYFQIVGSGERGGVAHDQEDDSSTTTTTTTTTSFLNILEMAPPGLLKKVPSSTAIEFDMFDLCFDAIQGGAGAKVLKRANLFWLGRAVLSIIEIIRTVLLDVEASVPAASLLTILPAEGGSSLGAMVSLDEQKRTLHLPVLTLKPNCGTLLRNLVAYEYMTRSDDARVLIGYLKLIAGLTRTAEDMSLLRRARVIDADGSDQSALNLFVSQIPPVFLPMIRLHGLAQEVAMDEMENEAEELGAAMDEMITSAAKKDEKMEAMWAAKDASVGRTALDSQIQALKYRYNREPGVIALKRKLRGIELCTKFLVVGFLIIVAAACPSVIPDKVYKYVTLDCLYQWPCCPQGLFSALFTLVTGGFILNVIRALLG